MKRRRCERCGKRIPHDVSRVAVELGAVVLPGAYCESCARRLKDQFDADELQAVFQKFERG